jgi:hypothetical protein
MHVTGNAIEAGHYLADTMKVNCAVKCFINAQSFYCLRSFASTEALKITANDT